MAVVVHIDKFSGPIALLLHLVRREEMDIFDININEITKQYLESIKAMKKLNLEMAGDFIAMAATLIQIKSKMLLPQYNEAGEVVEQEDPRKDLVRRLLEYQMYQEAGHNLYKRELVNRNVWLRGMREEIREGDSEILLEEDNALYALISCYRTAMKNMKKAVHKVSQSLQSIADRIWQMRPLLVVGQPTTLSALAAYPALSGVPPLTSVAKAEIVPSVEGAVDGAVVDGAVADIGSGAAAVDLAPAVAVSPITAPAVLTSPDYKGRLLITFLSLLELSKIGLTNIFQSENFADVHVETKGTIDRDAISKVENYESQVATDGAAGDIWLQSEEPTVASADVSGEELQMALTAAETADEAPASEASAIAAPRVVADEPLIIEAATDEEIEAAFNEEFAKDAGASAVELMVAQSDVILDSPADQSVEQSEILAQPQSEILDELIADADGATLTQLLAELGPIPVQDQVADLMAGAAANDTNEINDFTYPPKTDEPETEA